MHLNQGGAMPPNSFCVARIEDLEKVYSRGFNLEHYTIHYLVPFLFQQSFFELNGRWPWLNYAHGPRGSAGYLDYS